MIKTKERDLPKELRKILPGMEQWKLRLICCFVFLCVALIIADALAFILLDPELFQPSKKNQSFAQIVPYMMSESFAYEENSGDLIVFVVDKQMNSYIVQLNKKNFAEYAELIDFTYSSDLPFPQCKVIKGVPAEIDEDVKGFALEGYNQFWGDDVVDEANFDEILGIRLLDASKTLSDLDIVILIVGVWLAAGFLAIPLLLMPNKKKRNRYLNLIADYGKETITSLAENIKKDKLHYWEEADLYSNSSVIINLQSGFEICWLEDVRFVYLESATVNITREVIYTKLMVDTTKRKRMVLASLKDTPKNKAAAENLMKQIQEQIHIWERERMLGTTSKLLTDRW